MLYPAEQAFAGRDERQAPLKTLRRVQSRDTTARRVSFRPHRDCSNLLRLFNVQGNLF